MANVTTMATFTSTTSITKATIATIFTTTTTIMATIITTTTMTTIITTTTTMSTTKCILNLMNIYSSKHIYSENKSRVFNLPFIFLLWTRVLGQRNAVFREQLETLQRMEQAAGLEEAFNEHISEADSMLLRNLEHQIESQFLQDDINSTIDIHKKVQALRLEIEEAEQLAMYQTSLENVLEQYKRTFENEDSRLNSAIIGTPISLFATNYRYTHSPTVTTRQGKDITQTIQDIANIKPLQKNLTKKLSKKKELNSKEMTDSGQEEHRAGECIQEVRRGVEEAEGEVKREECAPLWKGMDGEDCA
ncbi:hypothetical protein P4O66_002109 [Electrophorus voltai]|uniref:Uncharacterized protein n=1 Tax=Electrophorus voltai TaxID=2609070 RepID=A0AAD8Z166_9TELE|nr:hypothetical protein P4O66_002109 [Electrophorus voltai]